MLLNFLINNLHLKKLITISFLSMPVMAQAVLLQSGDVLTFTTTAGSTVSGVGLNETVFDGSSLDALDGLIIGSTQGATLESPGIDQVWMSDDIGVSGYHLTTSDVNVLDGSTLDFSGWVANLGGNDHAFGTLNGLATYTFDGLNFIVDYHWEGEAFGAAQVTVYDLHLAGTVSSVPVPAAVWLFGSGLITLVGLGRKKTVR